MLSKEIPEIMSFEEMKSVEGFRGKMDRELAEIDLEILRKNDFANATRALKNELAPKTSMLSSFAPRDDQNCGEKHTQQNLLKSTGARTSLVDTVHFEMTPNKTDLK